MVATVVLWIGGTFLVMVLYVLSVGPVTILAVRNSTPDDDLQWYRTVYAPILSLAHGNEGLGDIFNAYINWWVDVL
jgi:hypothetical protein